MKWYKLVLYIAVMVVIAILVFDAGLQMLSMASTIANIGGFFLIIVYILYTIYLTKKVIKKLC